MSRLLTLVKREIQEYKYGLVYAPWIVGIILCSIVVLVYLGFAEVKTGQFTFTSLIYADPNVVAFMKTIDSNTKLEIIRKKLNSIFSFTASFKESTLAPIKAGIDK